MTGRVIIGIPIHESEIPMIGFAHLCASIFAIGSIQQSIRQDDEADSSDEFEPAKSDNRKKTVVEDKTVTLTKG